MVKMSLGDNAVDVIRRPVVVDMEVQRPVSSGCCVQQTQQGVLRLEAWWSTTVLCNRLL